MANQKITPNELHLFIIWEYARHKEKEIIHSILKNFIIEEIVEVTWSNDNFAENLSRFYGTNLPINSEKEKHIGTGPFLAIIVKDEKPVYDTLSTSKGLQHVNSNTFTSKSSFRDLTGGGHKIHGTNSLKETNHDLALLFGISVDDYIEARKYRQKSHGVIQKRKIDLIGSKSWESVEQMFYILNNTTDYVVLRNFENYPKEIYSNDHGDVDLLGISELELAYILNAKKIYNEKHRVHYYSLLDKEKVLFDFRFVGDGYYDERWEKDIIESSYISKGYKRPNNIHYYTSLAYHALLHKPNFSDDYRYRLIDIAKNAKFKIDKNIPSEHLKLVADFMRANNYTISFPNDTSVYQNEEYIDLLKSRLQ
jgi:hypothetical protein